MTPKTFVSSARISPSSLHPRKNIYLRRRSFSFRNARLHSLDVPVRCELEDGAAAADAAAAVAAAAVAASAAELTVYLRAKTGGGRTPRSTSIPPPASHEAIASATLDTASAAGPSLSGNPS